MEVNILTFIATPLFIQVDIAFLIICVNTMKNNI